VKRRAQGVQHIKHPKKLQSHWCNIKGAPPYGSNNNEIITQKHPCMTEGFTTSHDTQKQR